MKDRHYRVTETEMVRVIAVYSIRAQSKEEAREKLIAGEALTCLERDQEITSSRVRVDLENK